MKTLLVWADRHSYLMFILFVFWAMFWTSNGADKFFNGRSLPNLAPWAAASVLLDEDGNRVYTQHPIEPTGFFGVTRDNKMIDYFARISLSREAALAFLYGIAVVEIILGLAFSALVVWSLLPGRLRTRQSGYWGLFADRTIHRLCFKGGILVFLLFSTGDILFGDRTELWEHGTFMVLCLVTYDMWYRTDQFVSERERRLEG